MINSGTKFTTARIAPLKSVPINKPWMVTIIQRIGLRVKVLHFLLLLSKFLLIGLYRLPLYFYLKSKFFRRLKFHFNAVILYRLKFKILLTFSGIQVDYDQFPGKGHISLYDLEVPHFQNRDRNLIHLICLFLFSICIASFKLLYLNYKKTVGKSGCFWICRQS